METNDYTPDDLLKDIGRLVLAMGTLELLLIELHAKLEGVAISKISNQLTDRHIKFLKKTINCTDLDKNEKNCIRQLLGKVKNLSKRRNELIHDSVACADGSTENNLPDGMFISLKHYGIGVTKKTGGNYTLGIVVKEIKHEDFATLTEDIRKLTIDLHKRCAAIKSKPRSPEDFFALIKSVDVGDRIG